MAGVVLVAALAASGLLGGGTDPVVLPDDSTPTQSQTVITGGEEDPQVEDSSRLGPNALFQPDSFDGTVNVNIVPETNLLSVSVTSGSPTTAFQLLNGMLEEYPSVSQNVLGDVVLEVFEEPNYPAAATTSFQGDGMMKRGFLAGAGVMIVLFALILFGNYYFFNRLPSAFLPTEDKGTLFCEVTLPSGATLPRTEAALKDVSDLIQNHPGIESIMTIPGRSLTAGEGENLGLLIVNLKDWAQRSTPETKITAIQSDILQRCAVLPDASVNAFVPPAIMGLGATGGVTFSLQATGDQTSQDIAQTTNNLLSRIMETGKAIYAFTSFDANTPMLYLDINRAKAEAMNVPINSIFNALQSQLGSYYINDFNKYGKTYKVKIQLSKELRENLNVIDQLHVSSNDGTEIPLSALASLKWTLGPRQVERFNMFPSASINTQSVPSFSSGEMMALLEQLVQKNLSKDYQISWTDMSYQESQNEGKIVSLLMVSLLVAYLFLVAQYESWTMPISVMLSVATATLGAILALKLAGMSLDIYCQLGLLMLIGLTAKTAILMVEFSKLERDNGASIADAALNGMRVRFRSVMMTALSFVIGVFPMVVASGAGAGSRQSIGVTTFWGMLVATILGMMFIPGLYTIFQRAAESVSGFFHRKSSAEVGKTVSE